MLAHLKRTNGGTFTMTNWYSIRHWRKLEMSPQSLEGINQWWEKQSCVAQGNTDRFWIYLKLITFSPQYQVVCTKLPCKQPRLCLHKIQRCQSSAERTVWGFNDRHSLCPDERGRGCHQIDLERHQANHNLVWPCSNCMDVDQRMDEHNWNLWCTKSFLCYGCPHMETIIVTTVNHIRLSWNSPDAGMTSSPAEADIASPWRNGATRTLTVKISATN